MLCRSAAHAQHLPRRSGLTPAGQCNSPRPQTLMGGRGRRSGGGFSRPQGKQAPPTLAGHSATGEGQRGGGVATEEPTATTTKNFNGGSFAKWPPAAAAARGRQARPHGGGRSAADATGAQAFPPRRELSAPPRGRGERRNRRKADGAGANAARRAHTEEVLLPSAAAHRAARGGNASHVAASARHLRGILPPT